MNIVLASNSPRRQELLKALNFDFEVERFSFDESYPSELPADQVAEFIAKKKVKQIPPSSKPTLYITADTTVVLDTDVLGKPKDHKEAKAMLTNLSGNEHKVITGVGIRFADGTIKSFSDRTTVSFKALSEEEIDFYIKEYKPFDKAGAYGIQEWIGMIGIRAIKGSYYNVMGLPTEKLYPIIKDALL